MPVLHTLKQLFLKPKLLWNYITYLFTVNEQKSGVYVLYLKHVLIKTLKCCLVYMPCFVNICSQAAHLLL